MDEEVEKKKNPLDDLPSIHTLGCKGTGMIAAWAADQLAKKAYIKVVYAIRARKGS